MMIGGYLTTVLVALLPPLWHALITWDRDFASAEEQLLAAEANAKCGLRPREPSRPASARSATA